MNWTQYKRHYKIDYLTQTHMLGPGVYIFSPQVSDKRTNWECKIAISQSKQSHAQSKQSHAHNNITTKTYIMAENEKNIDAAQE